MNPAIIPPVIRTELLEFNQAQPTESIQTGLSEAMIWKCQTPVGLACLRAWPPNHIPPNHFGLDRLSVIHQAMQQLSEAQVGFTPRLYCTSRQENVASDGRRFWELTTWLPGRADYLQQPSDTKLLSAMRALATVHTAWAIAAHRAISPTLQDRKQRLSDSLSSVSEVENVAHGIHGNDRLRWLARETCQALRRHGPNLSVELSQLESSAIVHYALRDIWSDHVLFTDETVTGIVDFGAVRIDEPTTDLVRLLSTMEPMDMKRQEIGLAAYEGFRGVVVDRRRFAILQRVAMLLSAMQWIEWLVVERRQFDAPIEQLLDRCQQFLTCTHLLAENNKLHWR
ncbi:MAG: phosphotransferase [Rubripirellula sp.]